MNGEGKINANTYISLTLLISIITATWIISSKLNAIEQAAIKLDYRMTTLENQKSRPDPWTGTDQLRWTVELEKLNPSLEVPEPKHYAQ